MSDTDSAAAARLHPGKVPWEQIQQIVGPLGAPLPGGVLVGPALGEDAALVELGGEVWAIATDPITFTSRDAGTLAVTVNANDVAACGARPTFFLCVLLLGGDDARAERAAELLGQVQRACAALGVALIGGHSEVTPDLPHSLLVGTMLGRVTGRPLRSGGARPGDYLAMTKWAGLEGTQILLGDLAERLSPPRSAALGGDRPHELLSVVPEATLAAAVPAVGAMHDVTEGGVAQAAFELARASGCEVELYREAVPLLPETEALCGELGLDPLGLLGSGALLIACGFAGRPALQRAMDEAEIPLSWIGRLLPPDAPPAVPLRHSERDELLKASLFGGVEAVLFDMDGTLIDSRYDWDEVRRQLKLPPGAPILESLDPMSAEELSWRQERLHAIESEASHRAALFAGVPELLALLRQKGLPSALVTNNTRASAELMIRRHGLRFDAVITRDDGVYKPTPRPLRLAAGRLGVPLARCLLVGDTGQDVAAAGEAGCKLVLLHRRHPELEHRADHALDTVADLLRLCRLLL